MALLQVRNFPDDIYEELILYAKSEQRSVAQQTVVILRSAFKEQSNLKRRRQELLNSLLEEEPVISGDYPSPADLIREDRDR